MTDNDGMAATAAALREQLRALVDEIDAGRLEASGTERAYYAGAVAALDALLSGQTPSADAPLKPYDPLV